MATTTEPTTRRMTVEEFLALPNDGVERWLIKGELREKGMTTRSTAHSAIEAQIAYLLLRWVATLPTPRGRVLSGEARVRLRKDPGTMVGMDVLYTGPNPSIGAIGKKTFLDGPPLLAVEIVSPSDEYDDTTEKVLDYLVSGVPLIWVVDPTFQTVRVHRPDAPPVMFNVTQELDGGTVLPGFRVPVAELFAN
jgi:Uma2 family endonuclease